MSYLLRLISLFLILLLFGKVVLSSWYAPASGFICWLFVLSGGYRGAIRPLPGESLGLAERMVFDIKGEQYFTHKIL